MFFNKKYVAILLIFSEITIAQKLVRGPYLQQPTQSSILIRWRTDSSTSSKIIFGKQKNSLNQTAATEIVTREHILKIANLEPDTKYFYEVYAGNNTLLSKSDNQFFVTAPDANSIRPIHIWAGGDFADISNQVYLTNQTQVRDSYLAYSKGFNPDLWLWLGDAGYGGDRDNTLQKSIFDFYGPQILKHVPFAATLGNHEFDEDPVNQQKTRDVNLLKITSPPTQAEAGGVSSNTKAYYSFNYGNTHIINLDSYGMDNGQFRLYDTQSPQYQWLNKDLEANKSLWTLVFFHHPPYTKRAHDSDTEEELRLLRQTLVPVFDKYKVDLVLNGHSHIYERSYLIKDHLSNSQSFDPIYHILNKNSGKYLKNEQPIINKTDGTMYVVAGTFGRLEPILITRINDPAHPSSYYSNLITGGSLALKIEDNRLDCEWLCADGQIRDRFTMFKNVSKTTKINLEYGEKAKLKASWPGTYIWSDGGEKREIELETLKSIIVTVKDSLGFLQDKFDINMTAQPIIEPILSQNLVACAGRAIIGTAEIINTNFEKWTYKIQLSDASGSFSNPIISNELINKNFVINVPKTAIASDLYRIRILPNSDLFDVKISPNFRMNLPATASFTNESIIPFQQEVTLFLQFKGSFPIEYLMSYNNLTNISNQENVEIKVKPKDRLNYEILAVKNVCNEGEILNKKVTILAPLGSEFEQNGIKVSPNPSSEKFTIEIAKMKKASYSIFDLLGKEIVEYKELFTGKNYIILPKKAKGIFILAIIIDGKEIRQKFINQ